MRNTKYFISFFFISIISLSCLCARPYVGVSQGLAATTIDVGMLNRSFEQQLFFSLPTVEGSPSSYLDTAGIGTVIFARTKRFSPAVIGLGLKSLMVWEQDKGVSVGLGFSLKLSYEFIAQRGVLFLEGSYIPWDTTIGTISSALVNKQLKQYLRFGYQHIL